MSKIGKKIKEFFSKLKKNKKVLLEENNETNFKRTEGFKQTLTIEKEKLELQKKYEKGEISGKELSPLQAMELVDLYKKQINDLNIEIAMKSKIEE